ncbi:MAG: hypothetical protein ACPIOQ_39100 [Promethearchaeia archaeon]
MGATRTLDVVLIQIPPPRKRTWCLRVDYTVKRRSKKGRGGEGKNHAFKE